MLLGLIKLDFLLVKIGTPDFLTKGGLFNSLLIGILFAAAFCPISAALFFGNIIQNKINAVSLIGYGVGTGLPVLILSFVIAFSAKSISKTHAKLVLFEKIARKITGVLFVVAGVYTLTSVLGISLNVFSWFTLLANYLIYDLAGLSAETHLGQSLHFFVEDVAKIFFLLAVVTTTVSFFRSKLNSEKVREYLEGKPKSIAYILAVLLGAITPFCSCSSIPLFIGFIEAGIPFGVTMAFLITSPMINEIAILVFASVVGWKLAGIYVLTGMGIGLLGGWLMEKFGLEKYVESYVYDIRMGKAKIAVNAISTFKERLSYAVSYAADIIKKIWLYIIIGIGIGAFLHGYVPQDFFEKYAGADNFFAVPLAVIFGIPLYSNATGVIPIAEALLGKSVPIGTVLAMMMSVVAISLPEMIILRKVLKARLLAYFALFLFFAFISVGYLYNWIF
ncbi:MAG: permease [Alphaproteobacteria bacterium]|nr:permease [Alphaproteobacteria bacterium]